VVLVRADARNASNVADTATIARTDAEDRLGTGVLRTLLHRVRADAPTIMFGAGRYHFAGCGALTTVTPQPTDHIPPCPTCNRTDDTVETRW
jgi:hypothetical protein